MMYTVRLFNDIDEFTLSRVAAGLDDAKDGDEIRIQICSSGGYVYNAFGIIDFLRKRNFKTTCEILGLAASAAAIIALSCDVVKMAEYGSIMLHAAYAPGIPADDEGVKRANDVQLEIIRKRCPWYSADDLKCERWFDLKTAESFGFVDEKLKKTSIVALCNAYLNKYIGGFKMDEKKENEVMMECEKGVKAEENEAAAPSPSPSFEDFMEIVVKRFEAIEHRLAVLEGEGKKEDDELKEDGEDVVYARRKALYAKMNKLANPSPAPVKAAAKKSKININNFLD